MSSDKEQIKLRFPLRLPPIVRKRGFDSNYRSHTKRSDINKCFHKKATDAASFKGEHDFS